MKTIGETPSMPTLLTWIRMVADSKRYYCGLCKDGVEITIKLRDEAACQLVGELSELPFCSYDKFKHQSQVTIYGINVEFDLE